MSKSISVHFLISWGQNLCIDFMLSVRLPIQNYPRIVIYDMRQEPFVSVLNIPPMVVGVEAVDSGQEPVLCTPS